MDADDSYPDTVEIHDPERSWKIYTLMQAFDIRVGFQELMEMPDMLAEDLMTWSYLVGIGKEIKRKREHNTNA